MPLIRFEGRSEGRIEVNAIIIDQTGVLAIALAPFTLDHDGPSVLKK